MKGCYVLVIQLENDANIRVGKLETISFKKGFYAYVGSAMNGIEQRINRHLCKDKKIHWHIDYLLEYGNVIHTFYKESDSKEECIVANKLKSNLKIIPNFGCSDCKCKSHLFYGSKDEILKSMELIDMQNT